MGATVLRSGLISGYPAAAAAFVGRRDWQGAACWRILQLILLFFDCGFPDTPPEAPAVHLLNSWASDRDA